MPVIGESSAPEGLDVLDSLVEGEQTRLSVEQIRRFPIPYFVMDVCLAWTVWHTGLGAAAGVWLFVMTLSQVSRTAYIVRLDRLGRLPPKAMLMRLTMTTVALGAVHAVVVPLVFLHPVTEVHYIMTMIMVGNAAGAISPAAGNVRTYILWSCVFGGTLALAWLSRGTLEGAAIATLLVSMFTTLTLYVRDQGRTLLELVTLSDSLRRERDRAERASEAKTRFFAAASHDLRQPLTALSYNAATVQALAQRDEDETLALVGEGICRALAESRGLLDSLLEVSQLDAGAVEVDRQEVDVTALLWQIRETLLPMAQERGLELHGPQDPSGVAVARTDPDLLRRILQNLVGNAIKFTDSGWVSLETVAEEGGSPGQVVVRVSDTGPGIPVPDQEHVFEEFYQVGNPERNRSRGLGLGLAIVRRLALLLDAPVTLQSRPGHGATFEINLPRVSGSRAPKRAEPGPVSERLLSKTRARVLIVDDEPEIRLSLTTLLETVGWEVRAAASQGDAVSAWESGFLADALLLDFRLNDGTSGLDTLEELRRRGCRSPALLVTGDTEPLRIAAARAAGIQVIYKPVDGLRLVDALRTAIMAGDAPEQADAS